MTDSRILGALILGIILISSSGQGGIAPAEGLAAPVGLGSGTPSATASLALPARFQETESAGDATPWWKRIYAAGFYDTRWDGWFLQSYGQVGRPINDEK